MSALALELASGAIVGFVLGLVGGGGSILAVPLLVHVVGVTSAHVAIGTSAVAVAVNALTSLAAHAVRGTIKVRCASLFAISGALGAAAGSWLGKALDGEKLLAAFGLLMLAIGATMLVPRASAGTASVRLTMKSAPTLAPRLVALGILAGGASGFFGIGGGFLIVPALVLATDMPLEMAVGSSLVAVATFGVTTAISYAHAGLVDWPLALRFILGGIGGGLLGAATATRMSAHKGRLSRIFAVVVILVGVYVIARGYPALSRALWSPAPAAILAPTK